jgi:dipeptidyl aminopeptidase/acylaminoacyl peptidase
MVVTGALLLILFIATAPAAGDERKPIVTSDLLRIRSVSSIDAAQSGSMAVFAVRSIVERLENEGASGKRYHYQSHLYLLDLTDRRAQPRQITFGNRSDRSPVISPNGRHIAFVRSDEETDDPTRSQIWIIPTDGGEARQVTKSEHGASSPQFSPDGRLLLFQSLLPMSEIDGVPPWPMERPQRTWNDVQLADDEQPRPDGTRAEIRAWLERNAEQQNPNVITRINFQDEQRLRGPMRFQHLLTLEWRDEHAEPKRITDGFFDHADARFTPDGRKVIYVSSRADDAANIHPDRVMSNELWIVNIDGSSNRKLLRVPGWQVRSPRPSHDGSVVAFLGQNQDEPAFRQWQIGLAAIDSPPARAQAGADEPIWLTDERIFDHSVRSMEWEPARMSLIFSAPVMGSVPLMTISPGLLKPAPVIENDNGMSVGVQSFAVGGGAIVYAMTTPANPNVLRVRDAHGDRLVMDLNDWVHRRELSMPQEGWITRPDGTRVHYWLMPPTKRERGRTYPLALQIHGGPSAMWGPGEMSMWHEFQLLCSWGYGVVYSNPRGSSGYGYRFQRANYQDWGAGPAGDVLAAVDQAVLEDWVDADRLVVTGGSYAGYLTAWIIAHDHRFKAAVAQRGVYHLPTFFGEGNAWRLVAWAMGGLPFESRYRDIIERESPFVYAHRIRTPLLIKHGSEDLRTGVSQSEMLYRALKALDRPVEFVRYPGAGHDMSRSGDPVQRMDRLNRIIEFFERHIDNDRPAPVLDE